MSHFASLIKPLLWSVNFPPASHCRYDHCNESTGTYRIEWKSWKERDDFTIYRGDDVIGCGLDLGDAKLKTQELHTEWLSQWFVDSVVTSVPDSNHQTLQWTDEPTHSEATIRLGWLFLHFRISHGKVAIDNDEGWSWECRCTTIPEGKALAQEKWEQMKKELT